jgi:hypothetical protein
VIQRHFYLRQHYVRAQCKTWVAEAAQHDLNGHRKRMAEYSKQIEAELAKLPEPTEDSPEEAD